MDNGYLVKVFDNINEVKENKFFHTDRDLFDYIQEIISVDDKPKVKFVVYKIGRCLLDLS